jgi:CRISPR system Cascade subunit CasB
MSKQPELEVSSDANSGDTSKSAEDDSSDASHVIWRIARMMAGAMDESRDADGDSYAESLSRGDLAELRRTSLRAPVTPALWRILHHFEIHEAPYASSEEEQDEYERKWAVLLMALAHCAGVHDPERPTGLHDPETPFGQALAEAEWSELRFVRLLEADPQQLGTQLRRVAQFLASEQQPADWEGAYWLLFGEGETVERTRLRMSRSYYGTLYRKEKDQDD